MLMVSFAPLVAPQLIWPTMSLTVLAVMIGPVVPRTALPPLHAVDWSLSALIVQPIACSPEAMGRLLALPSGALAMANPVSVMFEPGSSAGMLTSALNQRVAPSESRPAFARSGPRATLAAASPVTRYLTCLPEVGMAPQVRLLGFTAKRLMVADHGPLSPRPGVLPERRGEGSSKGS